MKLEEAYATAIYHAHMKGIDETKLLSRLIALLKKRGHLKLLPKICRHLKGLQVKDLRRNTAAVRVAKEAHTSRYKKEIDNACKKLGITETAVVIDDTLIGGYVVEGNNTLIDASYKDILLQLYKKVST